MRKYMKLLLLTLFVGANLLAMQQEKAKEEKLTVVLDNTNNSINNLIAVLDKKNTNHSIEDEKLKSTQENARKNEILERLARLDRNMNESIARIKEDLNCNMKEDNN
jgi:hypothetical protein